LPIREPAGRIPHQARLDRPAASPRAARPHLERLLASRRGRLHIAVVGALLFGVLLSYFLLPVRKLHIAADGEITEVTTGSMNEQALVERAGIDLQPGDVVRRDEIAGEEVLAVERATEVRLEVDGHSYPIRTQLEVLHELLTQAGVTLGVDDSVLRNGTFVSPDDSVAPPEPLAARAAALSRPDGGARADEPIVVRVQRAVPFAVVENGQRLELRSSRETLATALRDAGVRLGPGDQVQPELPSEVAAGLEVHIEHAVPVMVMLPDEKRVVYTLAGTVGEALAEAGLELPGRYRLSLDDATPITEGLAVHVIAISEESDLEEEHIESNTVYQPDPDLSYGETRVVEGHDGVLYRSYRTVYEDGALISSELVEEWYDPEPVDTVIYYSTADPPPPPPLPTPAPTATATSRPTSEPLGVPEDRQAVRTLTVYATWYNPASAGRSRSDPAYGITATGVPVDRGIVAVDPSVIPLGTEVYIPGYGYAIAADTGGAIRGNMIDLGYPDGVVPDWRSGWVEIYILG